MEKQTKKCFPYFIFNFSSTSLLMSSECMSIMLYINNTKAELALPDLLSCGCQLAFQFQVRAMVHYWHRHLSRGEKQCCGCKAMFDYTKFLFMASEVDFGVGCGVNVAFRRALCWAIWQFPLCICFLHLQGWMKHGFYCYSIGQLPATFSEAKLICEENKAHLATVTDRYGSVILSFQMCNQAKNSTLPTLQLLIVYNVILLLWCKIHVKTKYNKVKQAVLCHQY